MKAVVCTGYGPPEVLRMQDVAKPHPASNEVLVKVHATTVSMGDHRIRSFTVPSAVWLPARMALGIRRPRRNILGIELAGEVEAVGESVRRFQKGDRVFAATLQGFGAYAEYRCLSEDGPVAAKPKNLTYEEAAAVPIGARTALHYLRKAEVQSGQDVLIYGASGSVGTYAVQIAKHFGARVTAVCSAANIDLTRSLGADVVIDYTANDFTKRPDKYDVVFDTVGKASFAGCVAALKRGGSYLNCTPVLPSMQVMRAKLSGTHKLILGEAPPETAEALDFIRDLLEAGKIRVVVDRKYKFDEIVEAHRYVDQGRKKGNVVISIV
ncbi:NADPH:quinone reductase [Steroidobacter agaridevorans]|uniref:NADPH:quinone reductase n=1 Tax=Steroidobacter agaridevorans TaxID=2695856 RepID=A0A829YK90_9GAMM|nr:NAD(P)-dependent alcohol dehydrogenase [Steroidobacter agaridevorans]GFE82926.1 NADPH:quinone reductase [Steroidobacter agaridevorans]